MARVPIINLSGSKEFTYGDKLKDSLMRTVSRSLEIEEILAIGWENGRLCSNTFSSNASELCGFQFIVIERTSETETFSTMEEMNKPSVVTIDFSQFHRLVLDAEENNSFVVRSPCSLNTDLAIVEEKLLTNPGDTEVGIWSRTVTLPLETSARQRTGRFTSKLASPQDSHSSYFFPWNEEWSHSKEEYQPHCSRESFRRWPIQGQHHNILPFWSYARQQTRCGLLRSRNGTYQKALK